MTTSSLLESPEFDALDDDGTLNHAAETEGTFRLSPCFTRAEMLANPIQFLCPRSRFLARGVSTLITSAGGVGKTRLLLQVCQELETGGPLFGCELLRPERPMRCLYIGAEDHQPFFNSTALPLLTDDNEKLLFDVMLLPEVWPGFTLNRDTARQLAAFIDERRADRGGLDCVVLDPMVSLIGREYVDLMKNPIISRAFFNDCLAPLLTSQSFALVSANHDSKAGAAVSGSADQQNAARCVLQLSTVDAAGVPTIDADRHKDNLGFRFAKLVLRRDPQTLLLTWDEAASKYAYGAPEGRRVSAGGIAAGAHDPAGVMLYLCRLAAQLLYAPANERTKGRVEARLTQEATRDGHSGIRSKVRDCLAAYCEWQDEPARQHQGRRRLLVGVRNPNAAIDDFGDYLAGGPAVAESDTGGA